MSKRINVVHLIPSIGFGGGAENVVYHLCRTIDHARFRLTLLYWGEYEDLADPIRGFDVEVIKLPLRKVVSLDSMGRVARELQRVKARLIHTHFMDADWLGFWAAKIVGIPHIMEVHSFPFPEHVRHAWRYRLMALMTERIICVSGAVQAHVRRMTGIPEKRFRVVYNGIDLQAFDARLSSGRRDQVRQSLGLAAGDVLIGNVSRLIPDKGHEFLLKALHLLGDRWLHVRCLIIGDGPLRGDLEQLARQLGLGARVVFAGKRSDVPELLGAMDFFAFPTFNEAFGICVLEAMAAGLPVVAANDAGVTEIISHDGDGVLIAPGDAGALAEALAGLLADPVRAARLGAAARMRVGAFTLETMTQAFEALYNEVIRS